MAVSGGQITVTDSTPVKLTVAAETDYSSGYSVIATTSGPLHFGPSNVANSGGNRGALHPAGTYPFNKLARVTAFT
jgi:hypothetical protein